jgi:hypothetical protein
MWECLLLKVCVKFRNGVLCSRNVAEAMVATAEQNNFWWSGDLEWKFVWPSRRLPRGKDEGIESLSREWQETEGVKRDKSLVVKKV